MRKIISLICFLLPVLASAGQTQPASALFSDAPDQYIVVKGDTLWGISGRFFKDSRKWPDLWEMNKDSIKKPYLIYPGDRLVFDRAHGTLSRSVTTAMNDDVVKMTPQIQSADNTQNAIPSIPYKDIEPFLSQPLLVAVLSGAPTLVGLPEGHILASTGDVVYAQGITGSEGQNWQIYRPGKILVDPETHEILGHEAIYLGDVVIKQKGDISTALVTHAKQEIKLGDRLVIAAEGNAQSFLPRAPDRPISARVISIYGEATQAGAGSVITLNRGQRDGLQVGHVLALSNKGRVAEREEKALLMPDDRYGLVFIFRVFDKLSYALVMESSLPVQLLDDAKTP